MKEKGGTFHASNEANRFLNMSDISTEKKPQPPDPDDQELVQQAQSGDATAYEELVRRYYGKIYGLAYNMTGSREDAEDVTQEVFLKAWKALGRFRGQSSFYTWVYRIALNRTINFRKKRNRRHNISFDDFNPDIKEAESYKEFSSKGSVLRKMSLGEFQKKMNNALATLSEKHRAVVVMHDIQGMPHAEIAEKMNCSEGTVRSRLFYARKQLQVELSEFV
jgi:RNA polymerase sigma-70 factor (ECF subfamily)